VSAENVRLLVLDVDGVLTDGTVSLDDAGVESKSFHVRDGAAIAIWIRLGLHLAIISSRTSRAVTHRAEELGIPGAMVIQGAKNKLTAMRQVQVRCGCSSAETAVMGDDLPDLPMLREAALAAAPRDAAAEVMALAHFVAPAAGGRGAVRALIEHILREAGRWDDGVRLYDPCHQGTST